MTRRRTPRRWSVSWLGKMTDGGLGVAEGLKKARRAAGRWAAGACALLLGAFVWAGVESDPLALFGRHPDSEWKPFEERWDSTKAAMTVPMENLQMPLEYWPEGGVKARLFARRAQVFEKGQTIFAEGVRVEMLSQEGKPDGELNADGCLFDKATKRGYCRGMVTVRKDGDQIKGRGLYFSVSEEYIRILSECEIRTRRFQGSFGKI